METRKGALSSRFQGKQVPWLSRHFDPSCPLGWRCDDGEPDVTVRTIKIKAHSKLDALEKLGQNLRLFTDKLEVSGGLDIASQLTAARRRARMTPDKAGADEREDNSA
jgi:hypothetical protein